jgi:hypothetical protein
MKLKEDRKIEILTEHYLEEGIIDNIKHTMKVVAFMGVMGVFYLISSAMNILAGKQKRELTTEEKIKELEKGKKWCRLTRDRSKCIKKIDKAIKKIQKDSDNEPHYEMKDFDSAVKKATVNILPDDLKYFSLNWAHEFNKAIVENKIQLRKEKQPSKKHIEKMHLVSIESLKEMQETINYYSEADNLKPNGLINYVNKRKLFMFFVCENQYRLMNCIWYSPVSKKIYFSHGEDDAFFTENRKAIDYKKFLSESMNMIKKNPKKFSDIYL